MREFVTKHINRCIYCLYCKPNTGKHPGFLHPLSKGEEPFQSVHTDHLGLFETADNDETYVLSITCGFSKYVILKAVKYVCTDTTIENMEEYISYYGIP